MNLLAANIKKDYIYQDFGKILIKIRIING